MCKMKIAKLGRFWLVLVFLFLQVSCGNSGECVNDTQLSDYNTSGLQCTKPCDCSNLKYEGYCISGLCVSNSRSPAQRKGEVRSCKLLQKVGACEWGQQESQPAPLKDLVWGDCKAGDVGPAFPENTKERCLDGVDNDCDGRLDLGDAKCKDFCLPGQKSPCYTGDDATLNVGPCRAGVKTCKDDNAWGMCVGEKAPQAEACNKQDDDCDGKVDEGLAGCTQQTCQEGEQRACYPEAVGCSVETDGQGIARFRCRGVCRAGVQKCRQGVWGSCEQLVLPSNESCGDGIDNNCDGRVDEGCPCEEGKEQACTLAAEAKEVGECKIGKQTCKGGSWGDCVGASAPEYERCDGKDNDCNGQIDDRCACTKDTDCGQGLSCLEGVCRKSDCPSGQALCTGGCVELKTSNTHCGACGNACITGKICQEGKCVCPSGQEDCGSGCVALTSDADCGACGNACSGGKTCQNKQCACGVGLTDCDGACVELASNGKHCGACGKVCGAQEVCANGKCALNCPAGQSVCDGGCVNLMESSLHCGACGQACSGGRVCSNGTCACSNGTAFCDGACVDTMTSETHCGACGSACSQPRSCVQGSCACSNGMAFCGATCVDLSSSTQHCGSCGNICLGGKTCQGGQCACLGGLSDCGGTCLDTMTSSAHCGACGSACSQPRSCVQGSCVCPTSTTLCGTVCADLTTSKDHCGGCNKPCAGTKSCVGAQCVCPMGEDDCGSGCIALTSDTHCGACNNVCLGGKTCRAGQCACPTGLTDCNGTCVDTQTSAAHCGMCGKVCVGGASCVGGHCEPPTSLAAGDRHVCALTDCNKLTCWGANDKGQLGISVSCQVCPPTAVELPAGLDVIQVAAGWSFTCALFLDGSVRCWGDNTYGQLGYGDTTPRSLPPANGINLGSGRSAKKLSVGAYHVCVLLDDGTIKCWGDNQGGQLGYGDTTKRSNPVSYPIDLGVGMTAKDVSAGAVHTCAILSNDSVKCWGQNSAGQLGYGDTTQRTKPDINTVGFGGHRVKFIAVGSGYTCAILDDGTLRCWGANHNGQLGYADTAQRNAPLAFAVDIGVGRTVFAVAVAPMLGSHTCALLDDGSTKCWGKNDKGQLGYGDLSQRTAPALQPNNLGIGRVAKHLVIGREHTCAMLDDGSLRCWGDNTYGQIAFLSSEISFSSPVPLALGQVRCGGNCVSALEKARCGGCQVSCLSASACFYGRCGTSVEQVTCGDGTCLLFGDGSVRCVGGYRYGRNFFPVDFGTGRSAKQIAQSYSFSCAILDDDSVKCWGANDRGQLGYGDTTYRGVPDQTSINLGTGRTAKQIAVGSSHVCAILDNGSIKCWGRNDFGQLGYGDTTQRNAPDFNPIQLGTGRTAKQVAVGSEHTCVVLDNDTMKCWGANDRGQLGYGDATQRNAPDFNPIQLGTGRTAKQVAVGGEHTCVVLDNGSIKCWGANDRGQLGYGDATQRNAPDVNPIQLGSSRTAKQIAAGYSHTCVVLDNDTIKCWGGGGLLGYGDITQRNAPDVNSIELGIGRTAKQVATGASHTCVVLDNDTVKCWGKNDRGELGYGDLVQRMAPDALPLRLP